MSGSRRRPCQPALPRTPLFALDLIEYWVKASRQVADLWRNGVRAQQDAMLAGWRAAMVRDVSSGTRDNAP
jgi:hypothetical protein